MAVFTRVKTWVSNEVLTASDLNGEFNNLLNNTIPESIEDYSTNVSTMQTTADPGGVGTESLATTLAGEITRLRYKIKQIMNGAQWYSTPVGSLSTGGITDSTLASNSVTTVKILDLAVTQPKLAVNAVDTGNIVNSSVTTAKIADLNVTTAKLAANNVTRAKLEAVGQQVSASSGSAATTSGTYAAVTNLAVTITTTGRPVVVCLIGVDSASSTLSATNNAGSEASMGVRIQRDGTTDVFETTVYIKATGATDVVGINSPGCIFHIDVVGAGTYSYATQFRVVTGSAGGINNCRMLAYEL